MEMDEIAVRLGYLVIASSVFGVIVGAPLAGWALVCWLGKKKGW